MNDEMLGTQKSRDSFYAVKSEELKISPTSPTSTIFFATEAGSQTEMLRVSQDGFYVRGVKLEQDADEARKVWEAFIEWMRKVGAL